MTNVEALKALYAALGGSAEDVAEVSDIAAMISAIASFVGAGGAAELPAVTSSDNGKVLTVSSGKWAKKAIPSQLPTVSATDNGKVLKVIEGVWAVGNDATE